MLGLDPEDKLSLAKATALRVEALIRLSLLDDIILDSISKVNLSEFYLFISLILPIMDVFSA